MDRVLKPYIQKDLDEKIVLLTGPRQVGKTTLAKQLFRQFSYYSFDDPEHRIALQKRTWPRQTDLVIFDELHKMKNWKSWIKGIYDTEGVRPRILVTGSARLDIARKMGDSLAGRHFLFRLHPLSMKELQQAGELTPNSFKNLLNLGGFPEPFLKGDPIFYQRWRRSHLDIILRQDLLDLENVRQISAIETLIELLRNRVGSGISYESLARDLDRDATTVKRWLQILENLFIIFKVTPWSKKIARSILKEPKYYFYDNGQVVGDEGTKLENLVANALLKELHFLEDTLGARTSLQYLKNKEGKEIDFIVTVGGETQHLIEVKWANDEPSSNFELFSKYLGNQNLKQLQLVGELKREKETPTGVRVVSAMKWLTEIKLGH